MSINLIICSIIFSIFIIISILVLLRKKRVNIKYSLIWIILFSILLIATLIPGFLEWVTHLLGFKTASNMVISLILAVLVIITITLTMIVSTQDKKIRLLIQELSIVKSSIESKNEKNGHVHKKTNGRP